MTRVVIVPVLLLTWPALAIGQTSDTALKVSRFAFIAGCALDLSSTVYGVTSGLVVEGNVLLNTLVGDARAHPVRLSIVKAASCASIDLIALHLAKGGGHEDVASSRRHRKTAFWLSVSAAAASVAFGIWNLRQIREARSRSAIQGSTPPVQYSVSLSF